MRNHVRSRLNAVLLATAAAAAFYGVVPAYAADEITQERLVNSEKEAGNWLHHHKNYSATRFSTLSEINKGNVKNLKVAWTMHLGGVEGGGIWAHGGLEGTPVVENGMMYVTDGWGSVYKIDLTAARACCSGRWTRRPTMTGRGPWPVVASTIGAWRCGVISSFRTRWTAA